MALNRSPFRTNSFTNALLCVLVFLGSLLFLGLIAAIIIVILFYLVLYYRGMVKRLEGGASKSEPPAPPDTGS